MKVPVWCPVCRDQALDLLYVAHQHLHCPNCDAHLCALCPGAIARSIHEYTRIRRAAVLN